MKPSPRTLQRAGAAAVYTATALLLAAVLLAIGTIVAFALGMLP